MAWITAFAVYKPITYKLVSQPVEITIAVHEKIGLSDLITPAEILCLADNIFFEAGNQSDEGKKAVAYVTINRYLSGEYPANLCKIVHQRNNNVCQFSWVCRSASYKRRKNFEQDMWTRSHGIAMIVVDTYQQKSDPTHGALFYHANYVKPGWSRRMLHTTTINDHIFYRPKHGIQSS